MMKIEELVMKNRWNGCENIKKRKGISSIEDLDDIEFTDLEKDDFISYDSRDGKWKNVDFPLEMKTDDEEETLVLNINVFND